MIRASESTFYGENVHNEDFVLNSKFTTTKMKYQQEAIRVLTINTLIVGDSAPWHAGPIKF